jgi:UDPglucose--hexose-1-phosphate uridylyltransferase
MHSGAQHLQQWMTRQPHRRLNPLTNEWVLVSPQRASRPWQGQVETQTTETALTYDPSCYLCPRNQRAKGHHNPDYTSTFVFDNDFPALLPNSEPGVMNQHDLFVAASERGVCRVVCFSPRHDLTIAHMSKDELTSVVDTWCNQTESLFETPYIHNVQIFENRGAIMGASNPHPHCQIWANESVPNELLKESISQTKYRRENGACLLCRYLEAEHNHERQICANRSFAVVVPFWAVWPFETLVLGSRHVARLDELTSAERTDLGDILNQITRRYDALFGTPFPYTMGFHQCPKSDAKPLGWHLHAHFYPPLLRSATVRKFMVGYEMLAGPQRDITPELAAERLRGITLPRK